MGVHTWVENRLKQWPDFVLSLALIVAAVVIVFLALMPDHAILKAVVLAYVILP